VRLSLARLTRNSRTIIQAALKCAVALEETPEFRESWLEMELNAALESVDAPRAAADRRWRILLIEDHLATSHSVEAHFNGPEYSVTSAYDGARGLALALSSSPDIIILDLHLVLQGEYMDGYEVLKCLIKHPDTRHIPLIVWSQYHEQWKERQRDFPDVQVVIGDIISLKQRVLHVFLGAKDVDQLGQLVELMLA
jgi:CheY-like chemotaxis protein